MAYRLPSLNALRAFEASARHLSFTKAADELCVSQGAISRHIKILEESLNCKLFLRKPRGLELTPAAQVYLVSIHQAFDIIDKSTQTLATQVQDEPLNIFGPVTFMNRWLVPRLHRFVSDNPQIKVRLQTTIEKVQFDQMEVDIAIQPQAVVRGDIKVDKLFDVQLVPIYSQSLIEHDKSIEKHSDVLQFPLLHTLARGDFWHFWAEKLEVDGVLASQGLHFQNSALVYEAAKNGLGVGLGITSFIEGDVKQGNLFTLDSAQVNYPDGYYLNIPEVKLSRSAIGLFREWIISEAEHEMMGRIEG